MHLNASLMDYSIFTHLYLYKVRRSVGLPYTSFTVTRLKKKKKKEKTTSRLYFMPCKQLNNGRLVFTMAVTVCATLAAARLSSAVASNTRAIRDVVYVKSGTNKEPRVEIAGFGQRMSIVRVLRHHVTFILGYSSDAVASCC